MKDLRITKMIGNAKLILQNVMLQENRRCFIIKLYSIWLLMLFIRERMRSGLFAKKYFFQNS